jgi:hypothetical protein
MTQILEKQNPQMKTGGTIGSSINIETMTSTKLSLNSVKDVG